MILITFRIALSCRKIMLPFRMQSCILYTTFGKKWNEHENREMSNSNWCLQGSHCIFTTLKYNRQTRILNLAHQQQLMLIYIKTHTYIKPSVMTAIFEGNTFDPSTNNGMSYLDTKIIQFFFLIYFSVSPSQ